MESNFTKPGQSARNIDRSPKFEVYLKTPGIEIRIVSFLFLISIFASHLSFILRNMDSSSIDTYIPGVIAPSMK